MSTATKVVIGTLAVAVLVALVLVANLALT